MDLVEQRIESLLRDRVQKSPHQIAIQTSQWQCTWRELDQLSHLQALKMIDQGIKEEDHVGLWSVNSPNWVITFLATIKLGAIPILLNTCLKAEELAPIIIHSDISFIYHGRQYLQNHYFEVIDELKLKGLSIKYFCIEEDLQEQGWDIGDFSEYHIDESLPTIQNNDCAQMACMLFTSGTTAIPKGVMLSHYSLVNNARAIVESMGWKDDDRMCITVPMFHCFGVTAGILSCLVSGATMYILPYFKTRRVWEVILTQNITILSGVPSMFLAMSHKQDYVGWRAPSLRSGIIAGSPIIQKEYDHIVQRFPHMRLQPSYGQTETSPCVTMFPRHKIKSGMKVHCGKVIDHVRIRIMNQGQKQAPYLSGEIQVKGYNVMLGYYQEDMNQVFTEDGWLRTGDLGYLDEEGNLFVTGRLKEMIIRGGENIAPQEIEEVICELPDIIQVKVIGIPADVLQEEIVACIKLKEGSIVTQEGLRAYVSKRLANYKVPSYFVFMDVFPMNESGKIKLDSLKSAVLAQLNR